MEGIQTGRIVHISMKAPNSNDWEPCRAAIITYIWNSDGLVNVFVFPDCVYEPEPGRVITYIQAEENIQPSFDGNPCWHWPERQSESSKEREA